MTHRTPTLAIVAFLALGLALGAACKPDKDKGGNGGEKKADGTSKKVLNYFRQSDFKSLDPPKQFDQASAELITQVYDTLLEYHYLRRPYELSPSLVEEMPKLGEDKKTSTCKLRKGVKFADDACFPGGKGKELTADDVLYTLKRFADAGVNTRSYDPMLGGRIVGLDEYRTKSRENSKLDHWTEQVEGLKKIDSHTFSITLTREDPLALMPFASSVLSIVPKEAVDKYGAEFERTPVGTGAFILKENPRRGTLVFARNPNYFLKYPTDGEATDKDLGLLADAGKQLPLIDEVHMPLIEEAQPRMLKFLSGEIDWIGMDKDNFSKMAEKTDKGFALKGEYAKQFDIYTVESLSSSYWEINMKDELLGKNKALRQAIAYAMDVPGYLDKMYNGRGYKLHTIVPLPIAGSERDVQSPYYETNLELAKAKLVEAGYPNGEGLPPIKVEFRATTKDIRQSFEFHRAQMAKVGITLEGNFQTFTAFLKKIESANFQIADAGWAADYPDAENFYQLLYGPNKAPGPNEGAYENPEYDKLFVQMKVMTPGPERNAVIKQMSDILTEDVPTIFIWTPITMGLHQKWVGNMKRNIMLDAHFKYLNIDAAAKAKGIQK